MATPKHKEEHKEGIILKERDKQEVKKPSMYRVLLHNDDFTPGEWVIFLIQQVFHKEMTEAIRITMQVHTQGIGVVGVYTHEIAETKVATVSALAMRDGHPLMSTMEPE